MTPQAHPKPKVDSQSASARTPNEILANMILEKLKYILIPLIVGLGLGWFAGFYNGRGFEKKGEYDVVKNNLHKISKNEKASPVLEEYLKAKFYNLAKAVPDKLLSERDDFGNVDDNYITGLFIAKQPSNSAVDYDEFLMRVESAIR